MGTLLNYNWAEQPEVLFYGLVSEISGGQMPNKVTGATDYLTVAGSAGSETYQTPNTASYIAADTDYIWFKTDASQRTTTTAELIGYDFPRTIVKYADSPPYAIESIMILKAGETLSTSKENAMRDAFDLSIWWSNVLSTHGNVKDNRGIGQSIWTPETIFNPGLLNNGVLWYNGSNAVVTGSGVSQLTELFNGTNHAVQSDDAARPPLTANALNGYPVISPALTDYLSFTAIPATQSYTIFFVAQVSGADGILPLGKSADQSDFFYVNNDFLRLRTGATSYDWPTIALSNGWKIFEIHRNYVAPYNNYGSVDNVALNGDPVVTNATIGRYDAIFRAKTTWSSRPIAEIIFYNDDKSSDDRTLVRNWLKAKYGL